MPLDIALAESAYLSATTRWDDWRTEFDLTWNKPIMEAAVGEFLRNLDPLRRTALKKVIPKEMRELEKKYGGEENAKTDREPEIQGASYTPI